MGSFKRYFVSTRFCGLCRGQFPDSLQGLDAWQSEFRAVLLLDPHDEHTIEITDVASLPDIRDDVDVALVGHPQLESITICRDLQVNVETPRVGTAFCFHDWCYSSLIWGVQCRPPKSVIYKLVRTFIPSSSYWENICEARYQLDPRGRLQTLITHADQPPFLFQPLFMSRLPSEVRARIWEYVGLSTPYSTFILVAAESSRLARFVKSRPTRELALEQGYYLSVKTIMVFGTEYIRDLDYDKDHEVRSRFISDIIGLKFILSLGGICAIKVFGINWETEWLGKIPSTGHIWYGIIQDGVSHLRCTFNDLNCIEISSNLGLGSTNLILWDHLNIPPLLVDPDAQLFDYTRDIMGNTNITGCGRRFFRYVPFYNNDEYIRGLTVYLTGRGIVGLEAHFKQTSQLSGCQNGCALYFALHLGELIAHAWLRIVNAHSLAFAAPVLIIQTTLGRSHTFGPYILPRLIKQNEYKWIQLSKKGCIIGLYYENLSSGMTIMRLGVIGDNITKMAVPLNPQYHACGFPSPPIAGPNAGLFLSVALFSDLKKVVLCRVGNRCTGILIYYLNGQTAVLGQWHARGVSQRSYIYSLDYTSVTHIYFRMTKSKRHQIVTDISFSGDNCEATLDSGYQVFGVGMHIAWWFSELYDVVLPWTGEFQDIPEESKRIHGSSIL